MTESVACIQCLCERRISVQGLAQHLRAHHIGQKCVWRCGSNCEFECEELGALLEHCIMLSHDPKTACRSDQVDKQLVNLVLVIQRRNKGEVHDALIDLVPSNTPSSGSDSNENPPTSRRKRSNPSICGRSTLSAAIKRLKQEAHDEDDHNDNNNIDNNNMDGDRDSVILNGFCDSDLAAIAQVHQTFWTGDATTAIPVDTDSMSMVDHAPVLTIAPTSPSPSPTFVPRSSIGGDDSFGDMSMIKDEMKYSPSVDKSRPKVTCTLCGISLNAYDWKGLLLRERLRNHALCAHFPKKAWKCALCPLVSKVKSEVARHSRRVHLKNSVPILQMGQEEYQLTLNNTLNTCFPQLLQHNNKSGRKSTTLNNNSDAVSLMGAIENLQNSALGMEAINHGLIADQLECM